MRIISISNKISSKSTRFFLIFVLTCLFLVGSASVALALDTTGPQLQLNPPENSTITTAYGGADELRITATDPSGIDGNSIVLTLDNVQIPVTVTFDVDDWGMDDYTRAWIIGKRVPAGTHTASITVKDQAGNSTAKTWSFTIAIHPDISNITPPDKSQVTSSPLNISAKLSDPSANGAINPDSIVLKMGELVVPHTYTPINSSSGTLNAIISNLNSEKEITFTIEVATVSGSTNKVSWNVYYNPFGEMSTSRAVDCSGCHALNNYNKYVHSRGPDLETSGGTAKHGESGTCGHCHNAVYTPEKCDYCHNGQPFDIYNGIIPPNPSLQADRSCLDCHGPTGPMVVKVNNTTTAPPPGTKHDILPLHAATISADCTDCHSPYLTRSHNRNNKAGQPMDCNTCHKSTNAKVQAAIANKNTACTACHENSGHLPQHEGTMDSKCQNCHKQNLIIEHTDNATTANKGFDCFTCHNNTAKDVKRTIAANNLYCGGCHQTGHGFTFTDVVPQDITLYPGYNWTVPLEIAIFAGEPTTPAGYDNGQVVISNRRADVNASQLWDTYNSMLTTKGWTLKSGGLASGASNFTAVYAKDSRELTLKCYNTQYNDNAGSALSSGYRTEIWYK